MYMYLNWLSVMLYLCLSDSSLELHPIGIVFQRVYVSLHFSPYSTSSYLLDIICSGNTCQVCTEKIFHYHLNLCFNCTSLLPANMNILCGIFSCDLYGHIFGSLIILRMSIYLEKYCLGNRTMKF